MRGGGVAHKYVFCLAPKGPFYDQIKPLWNRRKSKKCTLLNCKINGTVHIFFLKIISQPPVTKTPWFFSPVDVYPLKSAFLVVHIFGYHQGGCVCEQMVDRVVVRSRSQIVKPDALFVVFLGIKWAHDIVKQNWSWIHGYFWSGNFGSVLKEKRLKRGNF